MFQLTPLRQAAAFTLLVLAMATAAGLAIPADAPEEVVIVYMYTPMLAGLVMMLVATRDGYRREGWRALGLGTLGLRYWPYAILAPLVVGAVGLLGAYVLPSVTRTTPDDILATFLSAGVQLAIGAVAWTLGEEFGWRGYLLSRLRPLGDTRALLLSSLVWAAWHLPLILLTTLYHAEGDRLVVLPLFIAAVVAAGFLIGYLRIVSDSVWPATLAHGAHNSAWNLTSVFMIASTPAAEEYVAGDSGIVITIGTTLAAWLLVRWTRKTTSRIANRVEADYAPLQMARTRDY